MVQTFPKLTTETLRPVVNMFLDRLTVAQWSNLEEGFPDMSTKEIVTSMCVDIVRTLSKHIYMALKRKDSQQSPPKSSKRSSGSNSSQKSVTGEQIQDCLGDTISLTLAEAMCVSKKIHCPSVDKVTGLVVEEVTERINSDQVSKEKEPQASKKFAGRLKKMSQYLMTVLKEFAKLMLCKPVVNVESELIARVTVTPLMEADEPKYASKESLYRVFTTKAVKMILEEQAGDMKTFGAEAVFSDEEIAMLETNCDQDLQNASYEIVEAFESDFALEADATSSRECGSVRSEETSLWQKLLRIIKTFFVKKFAKESILKFFAKLRNKFAKQVPKKDKASMKLLIDGVDCFVEDLTQEDKKLRKGSDVMCIYRRMARDITTNSYELTEKQLAEFIFHQLTPAKKQRVTLMGFVRTEVDSFMKRMWNWLNKQTQQHERRRDPAAATLISISEVVEESRASVLKASQMEKFMSATPPPTLADMPSIRDEAKEQAEYNPYEEIGGDTWDRLTCEIIVAGLLEETLICPSNKAYQSTITAVTELLWAEMKDFEMNYDYSTDNMKKTFKNVYKELCKDVGEEVLWRSMILQQQPVITYIVDTLKKRLLKQKQSSKVKEFFKGVYRTVAKPFVLMFRCG